MTFGASLFLIATGAILRYAVSDRIEAVDLTTVGLILMLVGGVGLVLGLIQMAIWDRNRGEVVRETRERDLPPR